jgi:HK97 gp10 family phage protein
VIPLSKFEYKSNTKEAWKEVRNAERRGLTAVGRFVRDEARKNAPIAAKGAKLPKGQKPGDLRRGIRHRVNGKSMNVKIGAILKAFWGIFHEKGTSKMKATPFLTPAVEGNKSKVREIFAETVKGSMPK